MKQLLKLFLSLLLCSLALIAAPARAGDQISVTHWGVLLYGAPYAVAMESAMLAPNAEVSMFPWKQPKERIPLAVRQIRDRKSVV